MCIRDRFDIGQNVVSGAAGVIHGNTSIDIDATIAQMRTGMENMEMCIRDRFVILLGISS